MTPNRRHALRVAVWLVVASEALLFAGLFTLYAAYRAEHAAAFSLAASRDLGWVGGTNTMILLTSSFAMAVAIHFIRERRVRAARLAGAAVLALGLVFLTLKLYEWHVHIDDGVVPGASGDLAGVKGATLFFDLYYLMTGLHALHVVAGLALVAWARRRLVRDPDPIVLECVGVYWHFVDLVWVFLWPLFYLVQ